MLLNGFSISPHSGTYHNLEEKALARLSLTLRPSTWRNYLCVWKKFIKFCHDAKKNPGNCSVEVVITFTETLIEAGLAA